MLEYLLNLAINVACFIAGLKLANNYNFRAKIETKEALERQYLRIRAHADADDPCKPYYQPISPQFMKQLRETGKARTSFKKSDLVK